MLHNLNKKTLDELEKYREKYKLSGPLLVNSESEFIDNINKQKSIMYIGQETNGWVNSNNLLEYEKTYKDFLYNCNYNSEFWRFAKTIVKRYNNLNKCYRR